jgi:hypothetical protein
MGPKLGFTRPLCHGVCHSAACHGDLRFRTTPYSFGGKTSITTPGPPDLASSSSILGLSVEGVWERRSGSAGAHHEVRDMLRIRGGSLIFATPNEHRLSGLGRSERLLGCLRERTYLELNVKLIYLLN